LITGVSLAVLLKLGYDGASKPVSYLPGNYPEGKPLGSDSVNRAEIKGLDYTLYVGRNGNVCVTNLRGEIIISDLTYYSSCDISGESWGLAGESVRTTSDSTISVSGDTPSGATVDLVLTVPKNKPKIDINITTRYSKNAIVSREALVALFDIPVTEIYKKNRQIDAGPFEPEYWLLREGVRFGSGDRSALVYHTPDVSSLQTDTHRRLLFVNLEYSMDHPFLNIPFQKDGGGRWNDLSEASYNQGETRKNSFSINIGEMPAAVPRIMAVPDGYLAGYVFTEHADGGNIRTHRAAYFGSEDITSVSDAMGGFAGHKIPVTKSIFYPDIDVPSNLTNRNDSARALVRNFMDQLQSTGIYDICLHGANADRTEAERWIKSMKDSYETATWIDHGMFAGTDNRQSFVCDGLNPASQYYTADLWGKYNTRYFWNAAVEELRKLPVKEKVISMKFYEASLNIWRRYFSTEELKQAGFFKAFRELISKSKEEGELDSYLPRRGSSMPTPLFWKHPTRTMNFYSWATDYVKIFSHSDKGLKQEEENLNKLIIDRGIFINHGYFVRNLYEDGVLINSSGKIATSPYFDKTLDLMVQMRDKGDLYITTIRDLLDYWMLIENISFEYMPDGTIYINNLNDRVIGGFSLVVKAGNVSIDGKITKFRKAGDDTIFWFDLAAKQRVRLTTE
jgi:hypothetical protein